MSDEDDAGSGDDFMVNAFQDDSESSGDQYEINHRKRKLPDDSQYNPIKKSRPDFERVRQMKEWADRSVSLMLNLRLQLYKVFENDDENVQNRAWKKIATMLFPVKVTGDECHQRFNTIVQKYVASWDANLGVVSCSEEEEEHFRFIEKLFRKSPKLRQHYLQTQYEDFSSFHEAHSGPENHNLNDAILGLLGDDHDSVVAQSCRQLVKMRQRQVERDRVFEEIIQDIISMQEQKHDLEKAFLRKFAYCEFTARDEQLGMLAQMTMCLNCSDSVQVALFERIRRDINKRADCRLSFLVLTSAYSRLMHGLFDSPDEETELWLTLLRDHHHFFIPQSRLANHIILNEYGFKGLLRIDRTTVEKVIEIFGPSAPAKVGKYKPISVERVVLLSLWYLVHNETFDQLSIRFAIREGDVQLAICAFVSVLSDAADLIEWPENSSAIKKTVTEFEKLRDISFPGVVGALGTKIFHVRSSEISERSLVDGEYLLDYDIAVQAVADSNSVFTSVSPKWIIEDEQGIALANARKKLLDDGLNWHSRVPSPDKVFSRTALCNMLARRNDKWVEEQGMALLPDALHVLGDDSYPLLTSLMVPFDRKKDLKPKEVLFNKQWELSWSVVAKAFGKAVNRFERLSCLDYSLRNCHDMIKVIFGVHNICMKEGDDYPARKVVLNDFPTWFPETTPTPEAIKKREKIMNGFIYEKVNYAYRGKV